MIENAKITIYASCKDNVGRPGTFAEFIAEGYARRAEIERAREDGTIADLKRTLPCATISGVFAPTRRTDCLVAHSGLMCIDIDHVDPGAVMAQLRRINCIAFASKSASGKGVFAVVRLKYPHKHKAQFAALRRDMAAHGIVLDKACCDVTRLRIASYDADAFYRPEACDYAGVYEEPRKAAPQRAFIAREDDPTATMAKVERMTERICAAHIDMTDNYMDWVQIGFALASMGEPARQCYHAISAQSAKYDSADTDRKFDNLLNATNGVSIATFFYHCKNHGLI